MCCLPRGQMGLTTGLGQERWGRWEQDTFFCVFLALLRACWPAECLYGNCCPVCAGHLALCCAELWGQELVALGCVVWPLDGLGGGEGGGAPGSGC